MAMTTQRLYRSRTVHMVSGVCGGLGQYFALDPTLIRLTFVLGTLFTSGALLLVYLAMWAIVPEEPATYLGASPRGDDLPEADPLDPLGSSYGSTGGSLGFESPDDLARAHENRSRYLGWIFVVLGVLILSANLHLLSWLRLGVTWPLFLILAGLVVLYRQRRTR